MILCNMRLHQIPVIHIQIFEWGRVLNLHYFYSTQVCVVCVCGVQVITENLVLEIVLNFLHLHDLFLIFKDSRTHSIGLSIIRIKIERIVCCQPSQLSLSFPSTFCLSTCLSLYLYLFLYLSPFLCLLNFLYKIFFIFITIPFLFWHNFKYGHPE